ncbi:hypothetical protein BDK51DRAFT_31069 [Blyttiomyces helicus]|uniref:Uncharacterized protein n=1 Tax=Blyttiomyces helicus TaxID=388810 RepID=A0A4P9W0Y7_9FUNG|nr:hypothetical protein BDK51DRAFT_31069 [Blyttiomyces helicus]|eukprot:RKO84348.1 hypothetical protein BDK51DRAFT_31069 [Blyttiomyces helicus]
MSRKPIHGAPLAALILLMAASRVNRWERDRTRHKGSLPPGLSEASPGSYAGKADQGLRERDTEGAQEFRMALPEANFLTPSSTPASSNSGRDGDSSRMTGGGAGSKGCEGSAETNS